MLISRQFHFRIVFVLGMGSKLLASKGDTCCQIKSWDASVWAHVHASQYQQHRTVCSRQGGRGPEGDLYQGNGIPLLYRGQHTAHIVSLNIYIYKYTENVGVLVQCNMIVHNHIL